MRVIILEDEAPALAQLETALLRYDPDIDICGAFDSVQGAVAWLSRHPQPDLILADIQLSDGLSLAVFEQTTVTCPVIFCTAYDEYLLDAFGHGGIDYLLKPIERARLERAVDKYRQLEQHFSGRLEALARHIRGQNHEHRRRVLVKKGIDYLSIRHR